MFESLAECAADRLVRGEAGIANGKRGALSTEAPTMVAAWRSIFSGRSAVNARCSRDSHDASSASGTTDRERNSTARCPKSSVTKSQPGRRSATGPSDRRSSTANSMIDAGSTRRSSIISPHSG